MKKIWVLLMTAFVDMIGFSMVFPLLPFYAKDLGSPIWLIGPLIASFSVAQLASSSVWGRLSDRYGRKPILLIGLGAACIAYVVFGLANNIWLLFASRIVQGAGGGTTGVIQAYVSESTTPANRARGLGWVSASTSAGVMIGPAIGSLAVHLGKAAPGLFAAALCLLNVLFAWQFLPESKPAHHAAPKRSIRAAALNVLMHPFAPQPRLIWIYAVGMGAFASMSAVVALYLMARFKVTATTIGFFYFYIAGLSVVMRALILGFVVDRFGETRVMRIGAILFGLGMALYPVPTTVIGLILVIPLVPIGQSLLFPSVTALSSHRSDPSELGQMMGVQQAFGGVARVIGPLWSTFIFQSMGPSWPFWTASALMGLVAVLAWRVPLPVSQVEPDAATAT